MLYRIWLIAASVISAAVLIGSCGGSKSGTANIPLSKEFQDQVFVGANESILESATENYQSVPFNAGIQREAELNYSLDSHPSQDGFTAVSMLDDTTPNDPGSDDYLIRIDQLDEESAVAYLSAHDHGQVLCHLRFDPAQWEVSGVISKNPWPTESFSAIPILVEDGLLQIANVPVGEQASYTAQGDFAEVFFTRPGSKTGSSAPATNLSQYGVIWSAYNPSPTTNAVRGTHTFHLDGKLGDLRQDEALAIKKDGDLRDQTLFDSGEGVAYPNMLLHEIEVNQTTTTGIERDGFGRWLSAETWPNPGLPAD